MSANPAVTLQKPAATNNAYLAMGAGIVLAAFAAILIRLALDAGLPALLIAAGRLTLAALLLTPLVWMRYRHELARLRKRDILYAALAGIWIAVHFITLIYSLDNTSVLVSQAISNSGPLWVALMEVVFLRARLNRWVWLGLLIALVGGSLIALAGTGGAVQIGANPALGNFLALLAAISGSAYLTLGRRTRNHISVIPYVWILYTVGAITASIVLLLTQTPILGYPLEGYFWLLLLTILVQLVAHTLFNFAVGYLPATIVSLIGPVVTVCAGIIAFLLFAEVPLTLEIIGSIVIVSGVITAVAGQRRRKGKTK